MKSAKGIGEYLIQRLYAQGVRHIFGVPGDYVLGFYDLLLQTPGVHRTAARPRPRARHSAP